MAIPITIPRLGWNMEQGVFVGWLKPDGATVRAGDRLFTLESDKATEDVEGFDDGVLHIPADGPREGDVVAVGVVIAYLLQPGEGREQEGREARGEGREQEGREARGEGREQEGREARGEGREQEGREARGEGREQEGREARGEGREQEGREARGEGREQEGREARGEGREQEGREARGEGRDKSEIVKENGDKSTTHFPRPSPLASRPSKATHFPRPSPLASRPSFCSPRARRAAARLGVDLQNVQGTGRTGRIRERDVVAHVPVSSPGQSVRQLIARRMQASSQSTAAVTLTTTIDATNLVNLRKQFKATAGDAAPSYTDMLVKLSALALAKHPVLNARWENERVVLSDGIHIGIAVDTDVGLVVPVVRDVPALSLPQIAAQTRDLIERVRQRKVRPKELHGGTFTVTSLGVFGIDAFTPIINAPECAVLGIGRIQKRAVVLDEQIVIRAQLTLSLTFDHRITDGAPAARFLQTLSGLIENGDIERASGVA